MLILNVDDDPDDLEFFRDAIKEVNPEFPCVLFRNGVELLDYLEKNRTPPDYIFIDINMPKMNGYECAQEIKLNHMNGATQIVMYSTSFNPQDLKEFNKEGFKYILKQNALTDLVKTIRAVISVPIHHLEGTL